MEAIFAVEAYASIRSPEQRVLRKQVRRCARCQDERSQTGPGAPIERVADALREALHFNARADAEEPFGPQSSAASSRRPPVTDERLRQPPRADA